MSKAGELVKMKRLMEGRDPLWIAGKITGETWEFQGVFSDELAAVGACGDDSYFIAPAVLNQRVGELTAEWAGAYFPLKVTN